MQASDREYFQNALMEHRRLLRERASGRLGANELLEATSVPESADYAAANASLEVSDRIAESESHLLDKIDLALQRLDNGTYEECADCGGPIPLERLRAKPAVTLCVDCQAKKEEGEKEG